MCVAASLCCSVEASTFRWSLACYQKVHRQQHAMQQLLRPRLAVVSDGGWCAGMQANFTTRSHSLFHKLALLLLHTHIHFVLLIFILEIVIKSRWCFCLSIHGKCSRYTVNVSQVWYEKPHGGRAGIEEGWAHTSLAHCKFNGV